MVGSRNYEHMSRVCGCVAVLLLCESALFRTILRNGCPVLGANGNLRGERRTSIRIRKKRMSDSSFLIGFGALLIALQTFAFCFIGKTSAKRQLAQLHARIAKLEASGTEPDEPATDE